MRGLLRQGFILNGVTREVHRGVMNDRITEIHPNAADIFAIAVTYQPDVGFSDRSGRIVGQVGALAIVDNGSSEAQIQMLRRLSANPSISCN